MHIFHRWNKWIVTSHEPGWRSLWNNYTDKFYDYHFEAYHLRRDCEKCGHPQFKRVEEPK